MFSITSCWNNCVGCIGPDHLRFTNKDWFHDVQRNPICLVVMFDDLWNILCHLPKRHHERGVCIPRSCHILMLHCRWYSANDGRKTSIFNRPRGVRFCYPQPLLGYHQSIFDDTFVGRKGWQLNCWNRSCLAFTNQRWC